MADFLPSSLDSKAEERKYVSNVLEASGYTKTFLRNCQKPEKLNVEVAQKPFETLGCIFAKPKDPVTKEQRTDAIYFTPCNDCDNEYIGQTKRQFGTRLKEHQKAVFLCKK